MTATEKPDPNNYEECQNTTSQLLKRPSIGIDVDYYQAAIDDPEVSEERKRELIEIIGAIVVNFIDMGFGVHPVQLAQKENEKSGLPQISDKETPSLQCKFTKESASERGDV